MKIADIINHLEAIAPTALQEDYDNAGLITGNAGWLCTGVLCTLDATEAVVNEAKAAGCNLVVAHHPIIFKGLKKINGKNYVEQTIITAIKNDIAIYAIHTNLDNIITGVNHKIADKLDLVSRSVLLPKANTLVKLYTYIPLNHLENVRNALFEAGAGGIGNYSECSFNVQGKGTFKGNENTNPFVGEKNKRHEEDEFKTEVIFPFYLQHKVLAALKKAHPYEEVAYEIIPVLNDYNAIGSGMVGELEQPMEETIFLQLLKKSFSLQVIRHTPLLQKPVKKVAVCGGAGSFLIRNAIAAGADFYIAADVKYHEFFDADDKLVIADIGHWESEQFTVELLCDILKANFPNFAVLKTKNNTNPVKYFT